MVKLLNIQPDTAVLIYQFVVQMIRFEALVKHFTGLFSGNRHPYRKRLMKPYFLIVLFCSTIIGSYISQLGL